MIDVATFFLGCFSSLFTIINPFSTASVFVTITRRDSEKKRRAMAKKACLTAALVLIIFALAGSAILGFFSITIEAFRIAGGILIVGVGYQMLKSNRKRFHSEEHHKEAVKKDDVSIIPLAIPMLSGPGAITTSIVLMGDAQGLMQVGALFLAIFVVIIISYIVLSNSTRLVAYIGETGKDVIDKIMGLIVLVVGIQFIINGVNTLMIGWIALI